MKKKLPALVAATAAISMLTPAAALADAGFDASSYQGCSSVASYRSSGASFGIIKINEGTGYVNPYASCQLANLASAGLRRGAYDFASPGSSGAVAEANRFNSLAREYGLIGSGVIPVLDWEPTGYLWDVTWAKAWLDTVSAYWGTKPLIYMSASTISAANWSSVANADYGLWVAGYPRGYAGERLRNPGGVPYSVTPWSFAAVWQYSSSGYVIGVGDAVDVDWFYGTDATWAKYANSPVATSTTGRKTTTAASGAPTADANTLATEVIRGTYGNDPQRRALLGNRYAEVMALVNARLGGSGVIAAYPNYYTVKSGDYLSRVWPDTWRTIAILNGLRSPYVIYAGQRLRTTGGTSGSYTVRAGDTLGAIAAHIGTTVAHLAAMNNIHNINMIYAGTTLRY